jgi:hypothetical protein
MPELRRGTKVKHFKWLILLTLLLCSCGDAPSWLQAYDEFIERNKDNPLLYMKGSINECVNPLDYMPDLIGFYYIPDIIKYGIQDYWAMPEESINGYFFEGDCEDFAILTYLELLKHDIKSNIVIAHIKDNKYHLYIQVCDIYMDMDGTHSGIDNIVMITNGALADGFN